MFGHETIILEAFGLSQPRNCVVDSDEIVQVRVDSGVPGSVVVRLDIGVVDRCGGEDDKVDTFAGSVHCVVFGAAHELHIEDAEVVVVEEDTGVHVDCVFAVYDRERTNKPLLVEGVNIAVHE